MFYAEPEELKKSHIGRLQNSENPIEPSEKAEAEKLVARIVPLKKSEQDFSKCSLPEVPLNEHPTMSTEVLSYQNYIQLFCKTVKEIETERKGEIGMMVFDKDDKHAIEFVIAAANIRAFNFSIPLETAFKIKEMAGKIVPAISSSNALVAAMQTHEAIKLLQRNNA